MRLAAAGLADEPERLARACTSKRDAVDRLHRADLALEDDALRDREVLDEVADLDERGSPLTCARASSIADVLGDRHGLRGRVGVRLRRRSSRPDARAASSARSRQATRWPASPGDRLELRVDALVRLAHVRAARVERAARGQVDQATAGGPGSARAARRAAASSRGIDSSRPHV